LNDYEQYRKDWNDFPLYCIVKKVPIHLDIELTTRCNLRCEKCPYYGKNVNFPKQIDMDFILYKKIIDECSKKGVRAVKLNFRGEPLLYKKLPEAIRYAKKKGILDVQINTNGLLLKNKLAEDILDSNLDLLILSDYGKYEQIKNGISFQLNKPNKKPILRVKTKDPDLWINIADELEIPQYYDYFNIKENWNISTFKCEQPWRRMLVMANGIVNMCSCGLVNKNKKLGNIQNSSLEELWTSKKMEFLRYCHNNGLSHLIKACRFCPGRIEYIKNKKELKNFF